MQKLRLLDKVIFLGQLRDVSTNALEEALEKTMLMSPEHYQPQLKLAQETAMNKYGIDHSVKRVEEIYLSL